MAIWCAFSIVMPVIPLPVRWAIVTYVREGLGCTRIQHRLFETYGVRYAESTITRIIHKWRATGHVDNIPRVRRRNVRTATNIAEVRDELSKNILLRSPKRTPKRIATRLGISTSSVRRIIKFDLIKKPFKKCYAQKLTPEHIIARRERCAALLQRFRGNIRNIVFTDEALFTLDGYHNRQNQRIYADNRAAIPEHEVLHCRSTFPKSIMVWCGVSYRGKLPLIFLPVGSTLDAARYVRTILVPSIEAANEVHQHQRWIWQQDSAPAHRARQSQQFLQINAPAFIRHDEWPPNSPDVAVLDYGVFPLLKTNVYSKHRISNLMELREAIQFEWNRLNLHMIHHAIDSWRARLNAVVINDGHHFEYKRKGNQHFWKGERNH